MTSRRFLKPPARKEQNMGKDLQKKGYTLRALIEMSIEYHNTREATQEQLVEKMCISPEAAQRYIGQYWH